nr:hypothetical protein CFP56_53739 [Quercus suber]
MRPANLNLDQRKHLVKLCGRTESYTDSWCNNAACITVILFAPLLVLRRNTFLSRSPRDRRHRTARIHFTTVSEWPRAQQP